MGQNILYRSALPKYFSSPLLGFEQVLNCSHNNGNIHVLMWPQLQIMVVDLYLKPGYESLVTIFDDIFFHIVKTNIR